MDESPTAEEVLAALVEHPVLALAVYEKLMPLAFLTAWKQTRPWSQKLAAEGVGAAWARGLHTGGPYGGNGPARVETGHDIKNGRWEWAVHANVRGSVYEDSGYAASLEDAQAQADACARQAGYLLL